MIKALEQFFEQLSGSQSSGSMPSQSLHVATAALLIEVATADQQLDDTEWQVLTDLLVKHCELTPIDAETLAKQGRQASTEAASLYEFTQHINKEWNEAQKITLIESLWKVAYADGSLDKYEEHIIRRIADLLHVRHKDFIQTKIQIRDDY